MRISPFTSVMAVKPKAQPKFGCFGSQADIVEQFTLPQVLKKDYFQMRTNYRPEVNHETNTVTYRPQTKQALAELKESFRKLVKDSPIPMRHEPVKITAASAENTYILQGDGLVESVAIKIDESQAK